MDLMACSREIRKRYRARGEYKLLTLEQALDWACEDIPEEESPSPPPIDGDQARQMLEGIIGGEAEDEESKESDEESSKLLDEGVEHFNNHREEEAIPIFERLIRERDTPELHKWMGKSYSDLADKKEKGKDKNKALEKAALHWEEAAERTRSLDDYHKAGVALIKLGNNTNRGSGVYGRAVNYLEKVVACPATENLGRFWLAAALSELSGYDSSDEREKKLERSIGLFRQELKDNNSPNIKNWLGANLYKLAQFRSEEKRASLMEEAMPLLREACDERGIFVDYHWRGHAALEFGRLKEGEEKAVLFEEAIASFRKAIDGDSDEVNLHLLAESLAKLGDEKGVDEQIPLYEEAVQCWDKVSTRTAFMAKDFQDLTRDKLELAKKTKAEAKREAVQCPDRKTAVQYGYEHLSAHNPCLAAKYFAQPIEEPPDIMEYYNILIEILSKIDARASGNDKEESRMYDYKEALICMDMAATEKALADRRNSGHYIAFGAGLVCAASDCHGNGKAGTVLLEKAKGQLARAWAAGNRKNPEVYRWLGSALIQLGNRKEGREQIGLYETAKKCAAKAVELRGEKQDTNVMEEATRKAQAAHEENETTAKDLFEEDEPLEAILSKFDIESGEEQAKRLLEHGLSLQVVLVLEELLGKRESHEWRSALGASYRTTFGFLEGNPEQQTANLWKAVKTLEQIPAAEMDGKDHFEIGLSLSMLADRSGESERLAASERSIPHLEEAIKKFKDQYSCFIEDVYCMLATALERVGDSIFGAAQRVSYRKAYAYFKKAERGNIRDEDALKRVSDKIEESLKKAADGTASEGWMVGDDIDWEPLTPDESPYEERLDDFFGDPRERPNPLAGLGKDLPEDDEEPSNESARPKTAPKPAAPRPIPPMPTPVSPASRQAIMREHWNQYMKIQSPKSDNDFYTSGKGLMGYQKEDIETFVRENPGAAELSPSHFASYVAGLIDSISTREERDKLYCAAARGLEAAVLAAQEQETSDRIALALIYLEGRRKPAPAKAEKRQAKPLPPDFEENVVKQVGETGQYKLHQKVGEGELCDVFRATDEKGNNVAVKILKPRWRKHVTGVFLTAAERLQALNNKYTAKYIDSGCDGEEPYLVMEWLGGHTAADLFLDMIMEQRGNSFVSLDSMRRPLPWTNVVKIATQVASSLVYAHQKGVFHGCLRPSEVFYDPKTDSVKVADFSLTNNVLYFAYNNENAQANPVVGMLGIPQHVLDYLPEEGWFENLDETAKPKADVSSLGWLMYNLLTGDTRYREGGDASITEEQAISFIRGLHRSIPTELTDLVKAMISSSSAVRPAPRTVEKKIRVMVNKKKRELAKEFYAKYDSLDGNLSGKYRTQYGVTEPEEIGAVLGEQMVLRGFARDTGLLSDVKSKLEKLEQRIEGIKQKDYDTIAAALPSDSANSNLGFAMRNGISTAEEVRARNRVYREVLYKWGFLTRPEEGKK